MVPWNIEFSNASNPESEGHFHIVNGNKKRIVDPKRKIVGGRHIDGRLDSNSLIGDNGDAGNGVDFTEKGGLKYGYYLGDVDGNVGD